MGLMVGTGGKGYEFLGFPGDRPLVRTPATQRAAKEVKMGILAYFTERNHAV